MTLRDVLDAYIASRLGTSAAYAEQLSIAVRLFERWAGRPLSLCDLDEDLIRRFLREYAGQAAARTVNNKRRSILTLWQFAHDDGLLERPPKARRISRAREPKRLPEAWTRAEVRLMVAHARTLPGMVDGVAAGFWWSSLLLAIWDSSARISELLSVITSDVSLAEQYLLVRSAHQKSGQERLYWLSDETTAAIAAHWCPHRELVWAWPFSRRHLWVSFRKRVVEPCGLRADPRRLSLFHKLRRSTLSAEAAESLEAARRRAGHSRAETTVQHYVDPRVANQRTLPPALTGGNGHPPLCGRSACCCRG